MTNDSNPPTITEFLLARITEDEAVAQAVIPPGRAYTDGPLHWNVSGQAIGDATGYLVAYDIPGAAPRNHIVRHDPTRVLRECAAKRAIIDVAEHGYLSYLAPLAAVYADHPDYNPEWSL